ncbi:MAG: PEGA domain-containing protein, partial [Candidatus Brocadiia bacterium]
MKGLDMKKWSLFIITAAVLASTAFICGCVERQLTIKTEPAGGLVLLNDEEIGESPVAVSFEWYGDYDIKIYKDGYETLKTHRLLKAPWYDKF